MARQIVDLASIASNELNDIDKLIVRDISSGMDKKISFNDLCSAVHQRIVSSTFPVNMLISTFDAGFDPNSLYPGTSWVLVSSEEEVETLPGVSLDISKNVTGSAGFGYEKLVGAYGTWILDSISNNRTVPTGYHLEFEFSAHISTRNANKARVRVNNIVGNSMGTWSAETFRAVSTTGRFKLSDIVQEQTLGYTNPGTNLGWESIPNGVTSGSYSLFNPTITGYIVSDKKVNKWRRVS